MMRAMRWLISIALVCACSSNYIPRQPNQVAVILDNGAPAYVRDGHVYRHGFLGSGLVEAVRGNRAAETAAHEYRSRLGSGLAVTLIGLACMTGGMVYGLEHAVDETGNDTAARNGALVALGCGIMSIAGAGYAASAEPYRWDAINLFNDGPPPSPFYGTAPGAQLAPVRPRATLQMR
jgi:hypothetical protein